MINLRKHIRKILFEAIKTEHFIEREFDRLVSNDTNFKEEKQNVKDRAKSAIDFVQKINFPGQDNIGILLMKGPNKYVHDGFVNGKKEHSEGSFIWVIIRGNDMETLIFGDSAYKPKNTQIQLTLDRLKNYILQDKNGDYNLTEKDLKKLSSPPVEKSEIPSDKEILPMINIGGIQWVINFKTEKVYKKNNPKIEIDLYSFLETVDNATQEKIINMHKG